MSLGGKNSFFQAGDDKTSLSCLSSFSFLDSFLHGLLSFIFRILILRFLNAFLASPSSLNLPSPTFFFFILLLLHLPLFIFFVLVPLLPKLTFPHILLLYSSTSSSSVSLFRSSFPVLLFPFFLFLFFYLSHLHLLHALLVLCALKPSCWKHIIASSMTLRSSTLSRVPRIVQHGNESTVTERVFSSNK